MFPTIDNDVFKNIYYCFKLPIKFPDKTEEKSIGMVQKWFSYCASLTESKDFLQIEDISFSLLIWSL